MTVSTIPLDRTAPVGFSKGPALALIVLLLAAGLPLVTQDSFFIHSAIMVLFFAYMATAWNFLCGYVGQLSLGHAMFSGMGGYVSVLLFTTFGLSPWLGMIVGGLAAAALSVVIGYPTFRLKGPYFTLTTIAFAEIVRIWVENTDTFLGFHIKGAEGLVVPMVGESFAAFQFGGKIPYYYIILGMLALAILATLIMERSKLGYCLKAIRGDRDAAEALGISPTRYTLTAFAISAFMTALGGSFYAQFFRYINPERNMGTELSIDMALMSIIGGQGTAFGPLIGALILTPLAEVTRGYLGGTFLGLHLVIYGIVLMLAVLYFPKGVLEPLKNLAVGLFRRRNPA
ncbi:branched-chain amino acid ABC transporter permease [Microvirga aerilata]|jgi:branched-chain amino acid transport system permease protein|uniref:Branched-chain amino acid ABC transporter permease n=1 Tax=Microvirga aerilata TaxID=670292 RepID=A0A937CYZ0_9HYPH|nr:MULTISPECIES: branched-chain amino acid ABC transporter permease [Microvirga]MBD2746731.1 branched-chain amino acid ABC transporter permease [Microvirga sp.]MBL0406019.1 branched-chain amino acid ABC transporter permease [Microvirga aerilata]